MTDSSNKNDGPKVRGTLSQPGSQIRSTLDYLQKALSEWEQIPEGEDSEIEQLKKKTRELIFKLNEQIRGFDL